MGKGRKGWSLAPSRQHLPGTFPHLPPAAPAPAHGEEKKRNGRPPRGGLWHHAWGTTPGQQRPVDRKTMTLRGPDDDLARDSPGRVTEPTCCRCIGLVKTGVCVDNGRRRGSCATYLNKRFFVF